MSFLLGKLTFLPCHRELCIVKASMVTVKCFVWTCEKHFPPELYLEISQQQTIRLLLNISTNFVYLLKEFIKHDFIHMIRSSTIQF